MKSLHKSFDFIYRTFECCKRWEETYQIIRSKRFNKNCQMMILPYVEKKNTSVWDQSAIPNASISYWICENSRRWQNSFSIQRFGHYLVYLFSFNQKYASIPFSITVPTTMNTWTAFENRNLHANRTKRKASFEKKTVVKIISSSS